MTEQQTCEKRTCNPTWTNTHDEERKKNLFLPKLSRWSWKWVFFFVFRVCDAFGPSLFIWLRHEMMRDELGGFLLKTGIMCRNVAILPEGGKRHLIRVATERSFGGRFDVKWRIITCANTQTWAAVNNVRDVCDYLVKVDGQFNRFLKSCFWALRKGHRRWRSLMSHLLSSTTPLQARITHVPKDTKLDHKIPPKCNTIRLWKVSLFLFYWQS